MPPRSVCRAGLHSMGDPANVIVSTRKGKAVQECRECRNAKARVRHAAKRAQQRQLEWVGPRRLSVSARSARRSARGMPGLRSGGWFQYRISPQELAVLQLLADGLTIPEIAEQLILTTSAVHFRIKRIRLKYGVATTPEAVAQGLKRGAVRPDRVTARRLPKSHAVVHEAYLLRQFIEGAREPCAPRSRALARQLDVLMSWTPEHAVSVLWAAGRITSKHVPQTRHRYRGARVKKG